MVDAVFRGNGGNYHNKFLTNYNNDFLISGLRTPDSNFSDSTFSFGDQSKLSISSPQSQSLISPDKSDVDKDTVYEKAVQFIGSAEKLKTTPAELDTACGQLTQLSAELSASIETFKEQADALVSQVNPPNTCDN